MTNTILPSIRSEKGITLVLALLLTGTVTIAALIIASLLVRELRLTDNIRKSLIAYYGAESGLESALYEAPQLETFSGNVGNVSSWIIRANEGLASLSFILDWEMTKQIPLYDVIDRTPFDVQTVTFCWENCGGLEQPGLKPPPPLAIEWTMLTLGDYNAGTWLEPGPKGAQIDKGIIDCAGKTEETLTLAQLFPPGSLHQWDSAEFHLLRFKHISEYPGRNGHPGKVNFTMTMTDSDGDPVPLNQETVFKVTGTAAQGQDVSRALEADIPFERAAYDVFDYVIYSDTYVGKDYSAGGGANTPAATIVPPVTISPKGTPSIVRPTATPVSPVQ